MTDEPEGGSERYFVELCRAMMRSGARVDVLTTTTRDLAASSVLGIRWDRGASGVPAGIGSVSRHAAWNVPARLARAISSAVLDADAENDEGAIGLGRGFHPVETWSDGGFPFRWTGSRFAIHVPDGSTRLVLSLFAPRALAIESLEPSHRVRARAGAFQDVVLPLGRGTARLRVSHTISPKDDPRTLGVAIRSAIVEGAAGPRSLDLFGRDDAGDDALAPGHQTVARKRSLRHELSLALLRGPLSPSLALAALRRARGCDAILAGSVPFVSIDLALAAGRLARKPVAVLPFFHAADPYHHATRIYASLARAAVVFSFTRHLKQTLLDPLGCRSEIIHGGIDPAEHGDDRRDAAGALRERLRIPPGAMLAVCVGRTAPSKRLDVAIQAVALARRSAPDLRLVVAGPGTERIPISHADRALGPLPRRDVLALLGSAELLLHPSEHESLGLVLCEAWAEGTPAIANGRCGALAELVRHGVDGWLVDGPESMAATLVELAGDRGAIRRAGAAGRERVLASRSWDAAGGHVLHVLEEIARA
ncbi:MAG: glycosyltransferase family 4 protein [Acidobacteriota bacterium]